MLILLIVPYVSSTLFVDCLDGIYLVRVAQTAQTNCRLQYSKSDIRIQWIYLTIFFGRLKIQNEDQKFRKGNSQARNQGHGIAASYKRFAFSL